MSQNATITTTGTTMRTTIAIQSAAVSSASPERNDARARTGASSRTGAAHAVREQSLGMTGDLRCKWMPRHCTPRCCPAITLSAGDRVQVVRIGGGDLHGREITDA